DRRRRRLRDRRLSHRPCARGGASAAPRTLPRLRHGRRGPARHHHPPSRSGPDRRLPRRPPLTPCPVRPRGRDRSKENPMSAALMTPELVRLDVAPPGDKHAVIGMMADIVAATGRAERDGLEAGLLKREESFATGMPGGFAIPHCRTEAVREAALGLVRLSEPVDFGGPDGPADLILAIAAPAGTDDQHLKLLAQLSRALIRPEFLAALRAATTPEEVSALVTDVVEPAETASDEAASDESAQSPSADATPSAAGAEATPVLLAITSCPTGIAHTYMAAESLENAAKDKGVTLHVETQGSGGITPFTPEQI